MRDTEEYAITMRSGMTRSKQSFTLRIDLVNGLVGLKRLGAERDKHTAAITDCLAEPCADASVVVLVLKGVLRREVRFLSPELRRRFVRLLNAARTHLPVALTEYQSKRMHLQMSLFDYLIKYRGTGSSTESESTESEELPPKPVRSIQLETESAAPESNETPPPDLRHRSETLVPSAHRSMSHERALPPQRPRKSTSSQRSSRSRTKRSTRMLKGEETHMRLAYCQWQRSSATGRDDSPSKPREGSVKLTNFRLMFRQEGKVRDQVPLGEIAAINATRSALDIEIRLKSGLSRVMLEPNASAKSRDEFCERLRALAFPGVDKMFAFSHHESDKGWDLFVPEREYRRLGLLAPPFRIVRQDLAAAEEELPSMTYPSAFVVPEDFDDDALAAVCQYRSRGRLPAVVWKHPRTHATLARSAQPRAGVSGKRCSHDEQLLDTLRAVNVTNNNAYCIFDARPKKAALGNKAMGKGFEDVSNYDNTSLHFLGINNIHAVREAYMKLTRSLLLKKRRPNDGKATAADGDAWFSLLKAVLTGAARVAVTLAHVGTSVLVHCSDGWDRTSQLTALAQLMLDPYYRTMHGFAVLIEKEWCTFGHQFRRRHGHGCSNATDDQRAPIFLQFLDAVYQLQRQFPTSFEFNGYFLVELADAVHNCRYGTFLFDNERQRELANARILTTSVWSTLVLGSKRSELRNADFEETQDALLPRVDSNSLVLWKQWFLRHSPQQLAESQRHARLTMRLRRYRRLLHLAEQHGILDLLEGDVQDADSDDVFAESQIKRVHNYRHDLRQLRQVVPDTNEAYNFQPQPDMQQQQVLFDEKQTCDSGVSWRSFLNEDPP
ncbi:MAG: hypothetical protein MHM6MM_004919 [Cercozoa sp. M6MM]